MDRFERQIRLAEVGPLGQARIANARVIVGLDGFAAEVAARYLAGAGVATLCLRQAAAAQAACAIAPGIEVTVDPTIAPDYMGAYMGAYMPEGTRKCTRECMREYMPDNQGVSFDLHDPACREICRGAQAALRVLRAALGDDKH